MNCNLIELSPHVKPACSLWNNLKTGFCFAVSSGIRSAIQLDLTGQGRPRSLLTLNACSGMHVQCPPASLIQKRPWAVGTITKTRRPLYQPRLAQYPGHSHHEHHCTEAAYTKRPQFVQQGTNPCLGRSLGTRAAGQAPCPAFEGSGSGSERQGLNTPGTGTADGTSTQLATAGGRTARLLRGAVI